MARTITMSLSEDGVVEILDEEGRPVELSRPELTQIMDILIEKLGPCTTW